MMVFTCDTKRRTIFRYFQVSKRELTYSIRLKVGKVEGFFRIYREYNLVVIRC